MVLGTHAEDATVSSVAKYSHAYFESHKIQTRKNMVCLKAFIEAVYQQYKEYEGK